MPLRLSRMALWLGRYPDNEKSDRCLMVPRRVFIFLGYGKGYLWVDNLKSVKTHRHIVKVKIYSELKAGSISEQFNVPAFTLSPLGLVPKKEPNSYRLIHNLSYPEKNSLNDLTNQIL